MTAVLSQKPCTIYQSFESFPACDFAKIHLNTSSQGSIEWIREYPEPFALEHLVFRMGCQLYFVHVTPNQLKKPSFDVQLFLHHADLAAAIPCLMPMIEKLSGKFIPQHDGWGLVYAKTLEMIVPDELPKHEKIIMSNWELQDFSVKVVAQDCENFPDLKGGIFSTELGELNFIMYGRPCGLYYVHVVASRFPDEPIWDKQAVIGKYQELKKKLLKLTSGYVARISLSNADDAFDGVNILRLYRGCGMVVKRHEWVEIL